jgi:hypothetical protein
MLISKFPKLGERPSFLFWIAAISGSRGPSKHWTGRGSGSSTFSSVVVFYNRSHRRRASSPTVSSNRSHLSVPYIVSAQSALWPHRSVTRASPSSVRKSPHLLVFFENGRIFVYLAKLIPKTITQNKKVFHINFDQKNVQNLNISSMLLFASCIM